MRGKNISAPGIPGVASQRFFFSSLGTGAWSVATTSMMPLFNASQSAELSAGSRIGGLTLESTRSTLSVFRVKYWTHVSVTTFTPFARALFMRSTPSLIVMCTTYSGHAVTSARYRHFRMASASHTRGLASFQDAGSMPSSRNSSFIFKKISAFSQ